MTQAIRQDVIVQKDHKIEICSPELKFGDHVEVIVLLDQESLKNLICVLCLEQVKVAFLLLTKQMS